MVDLPDDLARLRDVGVELVTALKGLQQRVRPDHMLNMLMPFEWEHTACLTAEAAPRFVDAVEPLVSKLKRHGSGIIRIGHFRDPTGHGILLKMCARIGVFLGDPSPSDSAESWESVRKLLLMEFGRADCWPDELGWAELTATMEDELLEAARRRVGQTKDQNPQPPADDDATQRLLVLFTGVKLDSRIESAKNVLTDGNLTADDKLMKIDALIPIPGGASAVTIGRMLGVTGAAVKKLNWWTLKRKGNNRLKVDQRKQRLQEMGKGHESSRKREADV